MPDQIDALNGTKSTAAKLFMDSERCFFYIRSFMERLTLNYRLRDACLLLAGERPYREYPADWVLRALRRSSFIGKTGNPKSYDFSGTKFPFYQWKVCRCFLSDM